MKSLATFTAFLMLCTGLAFATSYAPRTLDQKVEEADLIVLGTATAIGPERVAETTCYGVVYERDLRVDVKEVLWPPSYTGSKEIVFRYQFYKDWSKSWWDYTNTAGVFFLTKTENPEKGQWDRLQRFDDWLEQPTNAPLVSTSIKKLKKSRP